MIKLLKCNKGDDLSFLIKKHKLDKRRKYFIWNMLPDESGIEDCYVCVNAKVTLECSGCDGCGCEECGFRGKSIRHFPDPVQIKQK